MLILPERLQNYINSDYTVDDIYQGYVAYDAHANLGRLTSLLDTTSQAAKLVFGTLYSGALSAVRIGGGIGGLVVAIPTTLFWGAASLCQLSAASTWKDQTIHFVQFGLEHTLRGISTLCLGIPLSLLWKVFMIAADTLGIFLPEIGRWARNLSKILHAALANMLSHDISEGMSKPQVYSNPFYSSSTHDKSSARPTYHTTSPSADLAGGLVTQKALELLGLKKGMSFQEAKTASLKLLRAYHPDKGGEAQKFQEANNAWRHLREQKELFDTTLTVNADNGTSPNQWTWENSANKSGLLGKMVSQSL